VEQRNSAVKSLAPCSAPLFHVEQQEFPATPNSKLGLAPLLRHSEQDIHGMAANRRSATVFYNPPEEWLEPVALSNMGTGSREMALFHVEQGDSGIYNESLMSHVERQDFHRPPNSHLPELAPPTHPYLVRNVIVRARLHLHLPQFSTI
jgi:hypothetical protein